MSIEKYLPMDEDGKRWKLIEEMGELNAAIGKAGRWGYQSVNPELPPEQQETNLEWILREIDDVQDALRAYRFEIMRHRKYD